MNEEKNIELTKDQLGEVSGGGALNSSENRALNDFVRRIQQKYAAGTITNEELNEAMRLKSDYQNLMASMPSGSFTYSIDQFLTDKGYTKYL